MTIHVKGNTDLGKLNESGSIFQGNDEVVEVTVRDENKEPVDISGANSIEYQISKDGSSEVSKTKSGGGITVTDGTDGKFEVSIASSDTSSLSGSFDHEAEIDLGDISTLFQGSLKIRGTDI